MNDVALCGSTVGGSESDESWANETELNGNGRNGFGRVMLVRNVRTALLMEADWPGVGLPGIEIQTPTRQQGCTIYLMWQEAAACACSSL